MLTIAKFDRYDMVNTPKSDKPAFTIWFSGCSAKCDGCYNKILWDKSKGTEHEASTVVMTVCRQCENLDIVDVVFLGGEPMEQDVTDLQYLAMKLHSYGYKIWLYTGWEIDQIPNNIKQYMYTIKCGRYDETLKCDGIPSSTNQKFYRINDKGEWKEITFGGSK